MAVYQHFHHFFFYKAKELISSQVPGISQSMAGRQPAPLTAQLFCDTMQKGHWI